MQPENFQDISILIELMQLNWTISSDLQVHKITVAIVPATLSPVAILQWVPSVAWRSGLNIHKSKFPTFLDAQRSHNARRHPLKNLNTWMTKQVYTPSMTGQTSLNFSYIQYSCIIIATLCFFVDTSSFKSSVSKVHYEIDFPLISANSLRYSLII